MMALVTRSPVRGEQLCHDVCGVCHGGRASRGAQGMTILIFVILIGLLGVLVGPRVVQWWQRAQRRRRDIDRLVEQFYVLFRQLDQEKHSRP